MKRRPKAPPPIDWSVFDKWSENTCTCTCGHIFRSHTKVTTDVAGRMYIATRKACPKCGTSNSVTRASSDVESFSITKEEVGDG